MSKMITRFNSHFYRHDDGRYMPSVTTILGKTLANPGLNNWYKQLGLQADIVARTSADAGSRVHHAIDMAIGSGAVVILQPEHAPNFTSEQIFKMSQDNLVEIMEHEEEYEQVIRALAFVKQFPTNDLRSEEHLFSESNNYAGTLDLQMILHEDFEFIVNRTKVKLTKGITILDWKTGNAYPEQLMQLSAYAKMVEENYNQPVTDALIVYTNSQAKSKLSIKHLNQDALDYHFDDFLAVKNVYDRLFAIKPPVSIELPASIKF